MISLDQVLLLEEKVESAVQKIAQLKAENDALRTKCAELTNSLSAKSEQLSSFATDQSKIEEGILKALDRLNSVENSVLNLAALTPSTPVAQPTVNTSIQETSAAATIPVQNEQIIEQPTEQPSVQNESLFDNISEDNQAIQEPTQDNFSNTQSSPVNSNGQFDIF